jgi:alkylated DNA nucleotide flippase Atl1
MEDLAGERRKPRQVGIILSHLLSERKDLFQSFVQAGEVSVKAPRFESA